MACATVPDARVFAFEFSVILFFHLHCVSIHRLNHLESTFYNLQYVEYTFFRILCLSFSFQWFCSPFVMDVFFSLSRFVLYSHSFIKCTHQCCHSIIFDTISLRWMKSRVGNMFCNFERQTLRDWKKKKHYWNDDEGSLCGARTHRPV